MQRIFLNAIQTRPAAGSLALAGLLLFTGCAASMKGTLEAPVMTPNGGSFSSSQTVTVSDATPGAALHCTTDGSAPTKASPLCAAPVVVYKSETLSAVAVAEDGTTSPAVSATFTIALPAAAAPTISPAAGTYTAAQTVTLSDATTGATIYYTTDGTTPTTASSIYGGPITVGANETINAVAISAATTLSPVASAAFAFNFPAPAPVISPAAGTYTSAQSVTITDAAPGASIFYTLDGSAPTTSSNAYGGPIPLTQSGTVTVSAVAIAPGDSVSAAASAAYTLNLTAAAPVISPAGGTFTSIQTVTITDATPNAVIHYTTDGSAPTASSPTYSGPITISSGGVTTVSAIAVATGYANSPVAAQTFTLNLPPAPTPAISPAGGTFTSSKTVTITDTNSSATIYYTLNGTTPTAASTQYTAPITVNASEKVEAIAVAPGFSVSPAASATFSFNYSATPTPVISPNGGTFLGPTTVTLSDSNTSAAIYYTTDGTPASSVATRYTGPFTVSTTETLNVVALATGFNYSTAVTATITIRPLTGTLMNGTVSTGTTPIVGATVSLYAAGTTGYGSAPTLLTSEPSQADGTFELGYTCPAAPGDQVYLVATKGSVGGTANSSIALMTALGTCSSLKAGASFTINEVTTIASVYALAAFSTTYSGGGIDVGAPAPTADCVSSATARCNYSGLVNAFKTVNNLVNTTTGAALSVTPFYSGTKNVANLNTSTVPQARINTLADIIASCVEKASGCSALFTNAAPPAIPPSTTAGATPADTLQAALDIAQNPGHNVAALYLLLQTPAREPYSPSLTDLVLSPAVGTCDAAPCPAPPDFTLALTFTGGGLSTATGALITNTGMEIDSAGNILVTAVNPNIPNGSGPGILAKFDNLGEGVTPATTQATSGGHTTTTVGGYSLTGILPQAPDAIAIDQSGQIWLGDATKIAAVEPSGSGFTSPSISASLTSSTPGIPSVTGSIPNALTVDGAGFAWATFGSSILEVSSTGTVESPAGSVAVPGSPGPPVVLPVPAVPPGFHGNSNALTGGFANVQHITFASDGISFWTVDTGAANALYQVNPLDGTVTSNYANPNPSTTPRAANKTSLVADSNGNIYGCATSQTTLDVYNRVTTPHAVTATYPIANGRGCGGGTGTPMAIDGAGHIFALNYVPMTISDSSGDLIASLRPGVLDEFTEQGALISPAADGYVGTTYEEPVALQQAVQTSHVYGAIGLGIDGSGNIWAVNTQINPLSNVPGGVLVEYVGIAAPVVTPISVALANKELATRP